MTPKDIKNSHNFIDMSGKESKANIYEDKNRFYPYSEGVMMCNKCGIKNWEGLYFSENAIYEFLTCEEVIIKSIIE